MSDFLGNLHSVLGHHRLGNFLRPSLDNPKNSSQILECQEVSHAQDPQTKSESYQGFTTEIPVSCVRFKCCAKRGDRSYLSGNDQAELKHSFKDCARDEFLD